MSLVMSLCSNCGQKINFFRNAIGLFKGVYLCNKCQISRNKVLENFQSLVIYYIQEGSLQSKLESLNYELSKEKITIEEGWEYFQPKALAYLNQYIDSLSAKTVISNVEINYFFELLHMLHVSQENGSFLTQRLKYLKNLSDINLGQLPSVYTTIHLESDEICHQETNAIFHKVSSKTITLVEGRFVITNKRVHFLSVNSGWKILWNNIKRVEIINLRETGIDQAIIKNSKISSFKNPKGIFLELATKSGHGFYTVNDPILTGAIINSLTKLSNRVILKNISTAQNRHIPQDIKTRVWQRDQGRCVQCNDDSYLEFDHIIPFSKGGANSVNNLQLLCRGCNSKKSNRI